jgi:glutamine phosphoribosylpyrophosphate amidotransferase
MCGVVAIKQLEGRSFPLAEFKLLMSEASIRGVHATGVSYSIDGQVKTVKLPVKCGEFPFPEELSRCDGAIGHLRYSTSDLRYNQPNQIGELALAHNGVVTQAAPESWPEKFGVHCETKNDSEILLQLLARGTHPITLRETSQACVTLTPESISFWRNEQRPLYYVQTEDYVAAASTADIIKRALGLEATRTSPCVVYDFDGSMFLLRQYVPPLEDLQL